MNPSNTSAQDLYIPANTTIQGDVFTGGKREIHTGGGIYAEHMHYHPRRPLPPPRQAMALPSLYVRRSAYLDSLCTALSSGCTILGITGTMGIGKSTLATDFCREVEEDFPDGTLWGEFRGRPSEGVDILGHFLKALDVEIQEFNSLDERIRLLRSVLYNRRMLIVLDGLTDRTFSPRALLPATGQSCLLITTSDEDGVMGQAEQVIRLSRFTNEEAAHLLSKIIGSEFLRLPEVLQSGILRATDGIAHLLVQFGRQARQEVRHQGAEALQRWLTTSPIDWGTPSSLYDFTFSQLTEEARQVLSVVGMLAALPFLPNLVTRTMNIDEVQACHWLGELLDYSLLDLQDGFYRLPLSVYGYVRQQGDLLRLVASLGQPLMELLTPADEHGPQIPDQIEHLRALFDLCYKQGAWDALTILHERRPRQAPCLSGGAFQILGETSSFLATVNDLTLDQTAILRSDWRASLWNTCSIQASTFNSTQFSSSWYNSCDLHNVSFSVSELGATQWNSCNLHNVTFQGSQLSAAEWNSCHLHHVTFSRSELHTAKWNSDILEEVNFYNCLLGLTQLRSCHFTRVRIVESDLQAVVFQNCRFDYLLLVETDLRGAHFINCTFTHYTLINSQLAEASFQNCQGIDSLLQAFPPADAVGGNDG